MFLNRLPVAGELFDEDKSSKIFVFAGVLALTTNDFLDDGSVYSIPILTDLAGVLLVGFSGDSNRLGNPGVRAFRESLRESVFTEVIVLIKSVSLLRVFLLLKININ